MGGGRARFPGKCGVRAYPGEGLPYFVALMRQVLTQFHPRAQGGTTLVVGRVAPTSRSARTHTSEDSPAPGRDFASMRILCADLEVGTTGSPRVALKRGW